MTFRLVVQNYGKIKNAEIEIKPLTLFVGDNNSGKSYLLSMIWALFSGEQNDILFKDFEKTLNKEYKSLFTDFSNFVCEKSTNENATFMLEEEILIDIINILLDNNKNEFVKSLFNYKGMSVGKIKLLSNQNSRITLKKEDAENGRRTITVDIHDTDRAIAFNFPDKEYLTNSLALSIFKNIVEYIMPGTYGHETTYYLPAARTGFMLAKGAINQTARKNAFDFVEINSIKKDTTISPFPKSIIHFLDSMDTLNVNQKSRSYSELLKWIENNMSHGKVDCVDGNSGNVEYTPSGTGQGIPLRATSGVVTELTPLILLLKHSGFIRCLCYEEPEMCLHPQLQLQMGRLLIKMVNHGINIITTTHSDIILQHINNMCQLHDSDYNIQEANGDFEQSDLLDISDVSIYQFTDDGRCTSVDRIVPQNGTFEIDSFINALNKILSQTIFVSDIVESEDE